MLCEFCKRKATHSVIQFDHPEMYDLTKTVRCEYHTELVKEDVRFEVSDLEEKNVLSRSNNQR